MGDAETGISKRFGEWQYICHTRVVVSRQRIERGYSLHDWDDRKEAEMQTETLVRGFRQDIGSDPFDVLPDVDTGDLPLARDSDETVVDGLERALATE